MSTSRDAYHHGDLATTLEQAAMQLLLSKPAAEISLREVARAAGVSHNAPYHHFADRQGLLKVLAERSMAVLLREVTAAVDAAVAAGDDDPSSALVAGGSAYIAFAIRWPYAFDAVYDPTVCVPGSPTATMAPLIGGLEAVLAEAAAVAGLSSEAEAMGVWGMMHGLATLAAAGHLADVAALDSYAALVARFRAGGESAG